MDSPSPTLHSVDDGEDDDADLASHEHPGRYGVAHSLEEEEDSNAGFEDDETNGTDDDAENEAAGSHRSADGGTDDDRVWLVSSVTNEAVAVKRRNVGLSGLLASYLELHKGEQTARQATGVAQLSESRVDVPLPLSIEVLRLVKVYLDLRGGRAVAPLPWPLRSSDLSEQAPEELKADVAFIECVAENKATVYELAAAASYLQMTSLIDLVGAEICSWIIHQPQIDGPRLLRPETATGRPVAGGKAERVKTAAGKASGRR